MQRADTAINFVTRFKWTYIEDLYNECSLLTIKQKSGGRIERRKRGRNCQSS